MIAGITFSPLMGMIFRLDVQNVDPLQILIDLFLGLVMVLFWVGSISVQVFLVHFLFTLPMRRAERARLFLDLVDDAIKRGQSVEEMILSLARNRDRTLGVRFHLLAAHVENGSRFSEALKAVPRFLPPQITEVLLAGAKLGDLRRVLPACREILRDGPAGVRSAVHYMLLVVFFFSPVFVAMVMLIAVFIIPRFRDVAAGMDIKLWPETVFVFANANELVLLELLVSLLLVIATIAYMGGPGFVRYFQFQGLPLVDWVAWGVPWKRKRLQRTFSAMLTVLLDGGVPEAEAVRLAGNCTANEICRKRAGRIIVALQQGAKLDDAVRIFDDAGEFHWRLANATHARGGFLNALRGWHEALDARAFQQEEATAHVITTGLVILNGVLVGLIATAMFGILIDVLRGQLSQ
jgi:type II secretory pathway component PulF